MAKISWIGELKKLFSRFGSRTIVRVKFEITPEGIRILSAQSENPNFLSAIGNSSDCPLSKEYSDKFITAYGRLTVKPYFNKAETKRKE